MGGVGVGPLKYRGADLLDCTPVRKGSPGVALFIYIYTDLSVNMSMHLQILTSHVMLLHYIC